MANFVPQHARMRAQPGEFFIHYKLQGGLRMQIKTEYIDIPVAGSMMREQPGWEVEMVTFPERFNMAEYFLDRNLDRGRGNKVCLRFGDERWTYEDVVRQSNRAGHLLRELGAEVESRVLIALPDCPEFVACWFGAA